MERNPYNRDLAEMRRVAQQVGRSPQDANRGAAEARNTSQVGGADPTTGEWVAFGLLDVTRFSEGFRLA
jgi:hypothetical protein